MEIRLVTIDDLNALQEISTTTFLDAFGYANTEKDMQSYLEESRSVESLRQQLEEDSEFYFLQDQQSTVGYLKLNFGKSQTEKNLTDSIEVQQIYVIKEYQSKGLGKLLMDKAIERGKEKGLKYVWLGVWEHNPRAIEFYEKLGFIPFGKHAFLLGTDLQTDILMKRPLSFDQP